MNGAELVERLRARHKIIALGIRAARTTDAVRWAKAAGYDTIWVDMEHSSLPVDTVSQLCSCAVDLGLMPWVRVPERDYGTINRVLDGGALECDIVEAQSWPNLALAGYLPGRPYCIPPERVLSVVHSTK